MSSEEQEIEFFKDKLYSNFKQAGLLDNLKAQMRYSILEKLQKRDTVKESNKENVNSLNKTMKATPLSFRVIVSLISEFFEKCGYNYSNAVFLPEAKCTNQVLTRTELADILRLSQLVENDADRPVISLIVEYIESLTKNRERKVNSSCQTDFEGRNVGLEEKLRTIDFEFLQKYDTERAMTQVSFEEKLATFKKDYDKRMKAEFDAEVTRIREFEISNIRLEEAEKYRVKMESYREEIDRTYLEKTQRLKDRERETIERCKQQIKNLEDASYSYRQNFLKDMEITKMKEDDWGKQVELERENLKIQKERVTNLEKELQRQLKDIESQREEFRSRITDSKSSAKVELMREMETDRNTLYTLKNRLETEASRLEQYKAAAENFENQNKRLLEENQQILTEVKQLREMRKELEIEIDKKKEQIDHLHRTIKKDDEHMKLYDTQAQAYLEEVNHHKAAVSEYKDMMEQRKREQIENNQRFIREIENYQEEIEKLEKDKDILRKRILELENEVNTMKFQHAPLTAEAAIQKDVSIVESKLLGNNNASFSHADREKISFLENSSRLTANDPIKRYSEIDKELNELRNKREKELMTFFTDTSASKNTFRKTTASIMQQQSPQFKAYLDAGEERGVNAFEQLSSRPLKTHTTDLHRLERDKEDLKFQLRHMIDEDSNKESTNRLREGPSLVKKSPLDQQDDRRFEKMFDHFADKLTEDKRIYGRIADHNKRDEYESLQSSVDKKNFKSDALLTKSIESNTVKDIFRVNNSGKKNDHFEESQRSLSLENDALGDPKPIIFTNKNGGQQHDNKNLQSKNEKSYSNLLGPGTSKGDPYKNLKKDNKEDSEVDFDVIEDEVFDL